jgi:hypothetical protein
MITSSTPLVVPRTGVDGKGSIQVNYLDIRLADVKTDGIETATIGLLQ